MERFKALEFKSDPDLTETIRARMPFPNGYEASVVKGPYTYGGPKLYELAVMSNGHIVYDTPITDDVVGYQSEAQIDELLGQIYNLSRREG